MHGLKALVAAMTIILWHSVAADAHSLERRHQAELKMGFWNQVTSTRTEVGPGGVKTSVESSGAVGALSYGHWLKEGLALNVGVAGLTADVKSESGSSGVATETAVVASILLLGSWRRGLTPPPPHSRDDA